MVVEILLEILLWIQQLVFMSRKLARTIRAVLIVRNIINNTVNVKVILLMAVYML